MGNYEKSVQSRIMISSHEVRWFLNGGIEQHPALRHWVEDGAPNPKWIGRLGGKPDAYMIIPESADMGIKWREGQLQIKGLESSLGTQKFTGHYEGKVERWVKWSYEGKRIETAFTPWFTNVNATPRIVEIHKTRRLRKVRMNPFTPTMIEVDPDTFIDRGGSLEVTDLRVGGNEYSSVAFEAFPNDSGMHSDFTAFVNFFLGKLHGVELTEFNSMSYPAWLQTLV
jgi:hypothetical protein